MNNKRIFAREWLYLLIFFCIGIVAFPPVISVVVSVVRPTSKFNEAKPFAWWGKYSQAELEDHQNVYLEDDIKKNIQIWNTEAERHMNFLNKPLSEKNRLRMKYFNEEVRPKLFYIPEIKNAEKNFYKMVMENDILWMKKNEKWIEPINQETSIQSRARWEEMWLSSEPEIIKTNSLQNFSFSFVKRYKGIYSIMYEGINDSPLQVLIFFLIPYFIFQVIRSIRWAVRQTRKAN